MIVELSVATHIPYQYLETLDEETLATYVDVLERMKGA
jgi:hypothetical protein